LSSGDFLGGSRFVFKEKEAPHISTPNFIKAQPLKPINTNLNHPTDPDFNSFNPDLLKSNLKRALKSKPPSNHLLDDENEFIDS
jgi:hypothetical protein